MGIVYLARQVSLDRLVALKILGRSLDRESDIARFQREAQAVAKLKHPNIASIHFVGQDGDLCYMAMEYVEGASLRDVLDRLARTRRRNSRIDDFLSISADHEELEVRRFDVPADTIDFDIATASDTEFKLTPEAEQAISRKEHVRRCCEIIRDAASALAHAHSIRRTTARRAQASLPQNGLGCHATATLARPLRVLFSHSAVIVPNSIVDGVFGREAVNLIVDATSRDR